MLTKEYKDSAFKKLKDVSPERMEEIFKAIGSVKLEDNELRCIVEAYIKYKLEVKKYRFVREHYKSLWHDFVFTDCTSNHDMPDIEGCRHIRVEPKDCNKCWNKALEDINPIYCK